MNDENPILYKGERFSLIRSGKKEILRHPDAVVILPLIAPNKVVMIENRRIAVGQTLLELPAGTLEEDEFPLLGAKRELLEETGFRAKSLRPLLEFYPAPGYCTQKMHAFVAEDLQTGKTNHQPGEEIKVVIKSFTEILALMKEGKIEDAKSLTTLMYYILY